MKLAILIVFSILFTSSLNAQTNVGLKLFGLSIHPQGDGNAFLMPRKLDAEGVLVINLGAMASFERFFGKQVSIKAVQALYADCANRAGGFTHVGFRGKIFKYRQHSLSGGFGPTLIYRRNWLELEGYNNSGYFKGGQNDAWQYKFLWYGGELEYTLQISDKIGFATTFVPGYPKLMSLSFGIKVRTAVN
ncbi:MAG TPA: hypothetical protein VGE26_05195 [Sphingobacteriaceae bacterium]